MEGNGYPKTIEGLAYRLDREGCLYAARLKSEVADLKKRMDNLEGGISKAIWVVVVAAVASGFSLLNTIFSAWAARP